MLSNRDYPVPASPPACLGQGMERLMRQHGTPRIVRPREPVYLIGDTATHLYLLERGDITLSRVTLEGRELILEMLGAGDLFGETELLLGRSRASKAQARSECVIFQLTLKALLTLATAQPDFAMWLMRGVSERQTRMEERTDSLLFASAPAKVSKVLLNLAERHGKNNAEGKLIDYPITHQEIANLIGTTRETVSNTFMDFRKRGLIATHRRKITVLDQKALAEVARD